MSLPELTQPVSLTRPDGRLDRRAVGWSRQPLVNTDGIARDGRRYLGRNKRWEYWCVTTPQYLLVLTAAVVDYAAVLEVWVLDRSSQAARGAAATVLPPRGVTLPGSLGAGPVRARSRRLEIDIDELANGTRLRARTHDVSFDLVAELPVDHERLALVVPWSDTRFQYTVKDVARPTSGTVTVEGRTTELPAGECWAVLDHGRGRWPYDIRWNWGAGSGRADGQVIGLQVGGQWTDGTGSYENAVLVDGRLYFLDTPVAWDFDRSDPNRPWRIAGGGLDATFEPFYTKVSRTNLGIVASATDQHFGHWSGTLDRPGDSPVRFTGIVGWVEDVHNRW